MWVMGNFVAIEKITAETDVQTHDSWIWSPRLYPLSYAGSISFMVRHIVNKNYSLQG